MADLGIARMGKDADLGGTLTRADLADVVHNRLGLSRAESAQLVERVAGAGRTGRRGRAVACDPG